MYLGIHLEEMNLDISNIITFNIRTWTLNFSGLQGVSWRSTLSCMEGAYDMNV